MTTNHTAVAKEFIVAEVSKNWHGSDYDGTFSPAELVASAFEHVIAVNLDRGYVLYQFSMHRAMTSPDVFNETIIAVFRKQAAQ